MATTVIRYTTKPDASRENIRLIEAVFAELADSKVEGFRYAALCLDDGVSFVHIVDLEGDDNPLFRSSAFTAFTAGIADRCVEGPKSAIAKVIGSHRLPLT